MVGIFLFGRSPARMVWFSRFMRIMVLAIFLFIHILSELDAQSTSDAVDDPQLRTLIQRLDATIPDAMKRNRVPGAALALIRGCEVAHQGGYSYADKTKKIPVTGRTGFNVGSISKTVAAWGVMLLVERDMLELDAPVENYLTRWHLPSSKFDVNGVNVRRLLSHTAGLSLGGYPGWKPGTKLPSLEKSLSGRTNGAGKVRLVAEPGTEWRYSGGGYTLLQLVIAEVTHRSFSEYMKDEVLGPLGMDRSSYAITPEILAGSSNAHSKTGARVPGPRFTAEAAAGLHTTLEDLTIFAAAVLRADKKLPGRGLLRPKTVRLMTSPAPVTNGTWGLGYIIRPLQPDMTLVGHSSGNRGWVANCWVVLETGDGLVMLLNGTNGKAVYDVFYREWFRWLMENRGKESSGPGPLVTEGVEKYMGTWKGEILAGANKIPFTIELAADDLNRVKGSYTSKKSGKLQLKNLELTSDRFIARIEGVTGSLFSGNPAMENRVSGEYYQNGRMSFSMTRVSRPR